MNDSSPVPLPKRHRQSGDGLGVHARGSLCHDQRPGQVSYAPDRLVHPGQQTSTAGILQRRSLCCAEWACAARARLRWPLIEELESIRGAFKMFVR